MSTQQHDAGQTAPPEVNSPEELIRLQCAYYRRMNALVSQASAENFGRRLELISEGAYMPASGHGDAAMLAGLMNLDMRSVYRQIENSQQQTLGFGVRMFYSFASYLMAKFTPQVKRKPRPKKT
jgi:hypothetical protein